MADRVLRWPKVMPAAWYRDPAEVLGNRLLLTPPALTLVSCETTAHRPVHTSAPRDTYYTQARRLHIRNLMRERT
jgi:hypothetical protein